MSVFSVPQEEYRRKSPSHVNEPVTRRGGARSPVPLSAAAEFCLAGNAGSGALPSV